MILNNLFNEKLKLYGKIFFVQKLKFKNISSNYFNWFYDLEAKKFIISTYKSEKELLNFIKQDIKNKSNLYIGIFNLKNKHIGNIKFHDLNFKNKSLWLGVFIGEKKFRNLGIASNAIKLISEYFFNEFGIENFYLKVDTKNIPAISSYKKSGFNIIKKYKKAYLMKMNIKDFKLILGTAQFGAPYGTTYKKKLNNKIINSILKIVYQNFNIR